MADSLFALSLFSGAGGLDLGLEEALRRLSALAGRAVCGGVQPVAYVEREAYAAAVLLSRMEAGALASGPVWTDVRTFDGVRFRGLVDLVLGGSPCQDLSLAGKRAGLDGAKSGLFWQFRRIVEECQPGLVFWENVGGATKELPRVFDAFADLGYRGAAIAVRASDVGAPHRRRRLFLLAHHRHQRRTKRRSETMKHATLRVMTSTKRVDEATHETPGFFYDWLDGLFGFTVDVCAVKSTAKHPRFFSPEDNGLAQSWEGETCWMNPPYGRGIGQWCAKAADSAARHGAVVVGLLPDRRDTSWWRGGVLQRDQEARTGRFVRAHFVPVSGTVWLRFERLVVGIYDHSERLPFGGLEDGAPFPSAVVVWASPSRRPRPDACVDSTLDPEVFPRLTDGWPR